MNTSMVKNAAVTVLVPLLFLSWLANGQQHLQRAAPSAQGLQGKDFVAGAGVFTRESSGNPNKTADIVDIREEEGWLHLYPFGEGASDRETAPARPWHEQSVQFDFPLPFAGRRYREAFIYPEGFLCFDAFRYTPPPYVFPMPEPDPALVAVLLSPAQFMFVGEQRISRVWYRTVKRSLPFWQSAKNTPGRADDPQLLDEITTHIHDSVIGSLGFTADHALLVTWQRMGAVNAQRVMDEAAAEQAKQAQNTFQLVLATDTTRTFAILNYARLNSTGDTQQAKVGFNAGQGLGWTELVPGAPQPLSELVTQGSTNVAGRWIARVDENATRTGCTNLTTGELSLSSAEGSMLGGYVLNVSGPCFENTHRLKLKLGDLEADCFKHSMVMAGCLVPAYQLFHVGPLDAKLSIDNGATYSWHGTLYIVPPEAATAKLQLIDDPVNTLNSWANPNAQSLTLRWSPANLTSLPSSRVGVFVFGYYEEGEEHALIELGSLAEQLPNSGEYTFAPTKTGSVLWSSLPDVAWRRVRGGLIQVRTMDKGLPTGEHVAWSAPTALGWFLRSKWQQEYGESWADDLCDSWYSNDTDNEPFVEALNKEIACPCHVEQAKLDVGRFVPLPDCDQQGSRLCPYHNGAQHCVVSAHSSSTGAAQTCCYDALGQLWTTANLTRANVRYFQPGFSMRAHMYGKAPYARAPHVPSLSNFYNDLLPNDICCKWSFNCFKFYERRPSNNCTGYTPPAQGLVYGDPHLITYDGQKYTFNGKGVFTLTHIKTDAVELNIQALLDQPQQLAPWTSAAAQATAVKGVAIRDGDSALVEVYARHRQNTWRYTTAVHVNGNQLHFDQPYKKTQHIDGVVVRTPAANDDQSVVAVAFPSGVGLLITEANNFLSVLVSLPPAYATADNASAAANQTLCDKGILNGGLLGTFNGNYFDDFTTPECKVVTVTGNPPRSPDDLRKIHDEFGSEWRVERETALFQQPMLTGVEDDSVFTPLFDPFLRLSPFSVHVNKVLSTCGQSRACQYDYLVTQNEQVALETLRVERLFERSSRDAAVRQARP